ncbi:MAG: hypothetical protein R3C32_10250 [Chloroflexota bacterium]
MSVLAEDHRLNPSHYGFVIAAEGAMWAGGTLSEVGDADMFGHKHKASIAESLAAEIERRSGIETVSSELTYDLRSGEPDAIDTIVATAYANIAMDLIADGVSGRMTAIATGRYAHSPLPTHAPGPDRRRRRDVQRRWYRPRYTGLLGRRCSWARRSARRPPDRRGRRHPAPDHGARSGIPRLAAWRRALAAAGIVLAIVVAVMT